jgi:hypothetical protein
MGGALQTNAFAESIGQGKAPFALYTDPGLTAFVTTGTTSAVRGLFAVGTTIYAVIGETLYSVAASGAYTSIGTVLGTDPVITATNKKNSGPQTAIVADSTVYVLEAGALTTFADLDLPANVHSVAFLDGYLIFGLRDGRFFITALNDTAVDALDFAEAEGSPDNGVRIFIRGLDMLYFGENSLELWQNTGNSEFPFERLSGGFVPIGCKSKYSVSSFDNTVVWVDEFGRVVKLQGYVPARISNHGVEKDIQRTIDAQRSSEMEAFVWREGGHEFYQLSGPDWTWVFDAATQLWHKKESYGLTRSKIRGYVRSGDKHIVGDYAAGKLHIMSMSAYDESGGYLITTLRSPVISEPGVGIVWDSVIIDAQMGVGRGTDAHSANPQLMLRWSNDGGATWSQQRTRSLGAIGRYSGRLQFNGLGSSGSQGRIYEVSVSAPVERCFVSASAAVRYVRPN